MREALKAVGGRLVAAIDPQCDFSRAIFILAHMRCGSTALSNILCSRPDVSGYGEAHVRYDGREALGRLVINQARRGAWAPRADHLFDKILHSRHDAAAPAEFFTARAIFVARHPVPAIRSIRSLFAKIGRNEYVSDADAADYYLERVETLIRLWSRFPADRRIGFTHADLMGDPEAVLARISDRLSIRPALENRYASAAASRRGGGGDPLTSGKHTRIEAMPETGTLDPASLSIEPALAVAIVEVYDRFVATVAEPAA